MPRLIDANILRDDFDPEDNMEYDAIGVRYIIDSAPTIDPIRAAGGCRCGECRFEEDCEKQVTIVRRDHVLEQNVYEHRRVEWCGAGEPKEAQDDG